MTGRNISTQFVIFVCSENFDVVVGTYSSSDVWQRVDISFDELGIVEEKRRKKKRQFAQTFRTRRDTHELFYNI